MTLILAVTCPGYAVLVADRRLSSRRGIEGDEHNKIVTFAADNGRGVVAFTGLAQAAGVSTHEWLVDVMHNSLKVHRNLGLLVDELPLRANDWYSHLPPYARKESLSFVGVGTSYVKDPPLPLFFVVTNDRTQKIIDWTKFPDTRFGMCLGVNESAKWEDAFMLAYGWTQAVSTAELVAIQDLARTGRPPEAVRDKAVELIQGAAKRAESKGTIGGQCGAAIVLVDPARDIETSYFVSEASNITYMPSHVTPITAFKGGWLRADDGSPTAYPRVPRNAPCPCGSRLRYRKCHGRSRVPSSH